MGAYSAIAIEQWFGGPSEADPVDPAYPLRALADDHLSRVHSAPIGDDDRELADRVRLGDMGAFETLYRTYVDGMIGFAFRLCGSRAAAQDVVGELFVHLWERRAEWRPRSGLRAYLYAAVRHRVADLIRAERRADARGRRVLHDPSLAPAATSSVDAELELSDELAAVWRVVDGFPPLRRQVMYLRWARGLAPDEIAEVLGLNRNSVDKHVSRAVQGIREALGTPPTVAE